MRYLFFDTETTGLPRPGEPLVNQPYMVQLGAMLTDESINELGGICLLVNNGVDIPTDAQRVHGITPEQCAAFGVSLESALELFLELYEQADMVIGHNISFDMQIIEDQLERLGMSIEWKGCYCTMKQGTAALQNLGMYRGQKWLKLTEAYQLITGTSIPGAGAHNAWTDVKACATVFNELRRRDVYFEAWKP